MTAILWESEHGPNSADEINIIEKGHNYGWAVAAKSAQPGIELSLPGMDDPIVYFTPTFAPAGIAFYTGNRYPALEEHQPVRRRPARPGAAPSRDQGPTRWSARKCSSTSSAACATSCSRLTAIFYVALQDPTGVPNPAGGNIPLSASTAGPRRSVDAGAMIMPTAGRRAMKLLRYGLPGQRRPGLCDDSGTIRDLSGIVDDIAGETLLPASIARLMAIDTETLPAVTGQPRLGPCVGPGRAR